MAEPQIEQANTRKPHVDFDSWSELAQYDPQAFESRRTELIDQTIQRMPVNRQHRMRCLQWKIDQVRAQASNPLSACIKLSEMMWDSLTGPGGLCEALERLGSGNFEPPPKGRVMDFDRAP